MSFKEMAESLISRNFMAVEFARCCVRDNWTISGCYLNNYRRTKVIICVNSAIWLLIAMLM